MNAEEIKVGLHTAFFGQIIHCLDTTDSTNRYAAALAEKGAADGTIVLAEEQTRGRGRMDRSWHSPTGLGLWLSIILRPELSPAAAPGLSLVTGLALAQTIEEQLQLKATLRWPNDCLLDDKKVAGILIDLTANTERARHVVIGVGINVLQQAGDFPPELRKIAISLSMAASRPVDRVSFLQSFLSGLEREYLRFINEGLAPFIEPYTRRCSLIGCWVEALIGREQVAGKAVGVDSAGALILVDGDKKIVLTTGEVRRVR